jgi:bifunctional UDP-N-acetylglucosamine pyrophosphorylase/glucosamine-1-phosphate N-acetyltransferase
MEKTSASSSPLAIIVLAAGKGTRMRSDLPKVLHKVAHAPMLAHVLLAAEHADAAKVVVVTATDGAAVRDAASAILPTVDFAEQPSQKGTGDAVKCGLTALPANWEGTVVVAYGDTPLIRAETLLAAANAVNDSTPVAVVGVQVPVPNAYGRLVLGNNNTLERIVETKDATEEERQITLCNSGIMAVRASLLKSTLEQLKPTNAQGEYYLTDVVGLARAAGHSCAVVEGDATELAGVNSKVELAQAEAAFQVRKRREMLEQGITLIAPDTVYFAQDTQLGRDTVVHPFVVFGPNVNLGEGTVVNAFSHIEGATSEEHAKIGPFARLRPGSELGSKAQVGNFVELKKTRMEAGAKANHLAYLGDALIGSQANIGAGTITCNYDGYSKYPTIIGKQAFIGSNTALIAPVNIGEGAITAAGSVITEDVEADSLAIARPVQKAKPGWAKLFRNARNN